MQIHRWWSGRIGWLRGRWAWATRNRLFWCNVLMIGILLVTLMRPGPSDLRLRILGTILQIVGIVTVWYDLTATAQRFKKDGMVGRTLLWLKEVFRGRNVVLEVHAAEMVITGFDARATVRRKMDAALPVDKRLEAVEYNITQVDKDLDDAFNKISKSTAETKGQLADETAARELAIGEVKRDIEGATVGHYPLLVFGVVWLATGVFVATLSEELWLTLAGRWGELWARAF